jgi:hypothetical protein
MAILQSTCITINVLLILGGRGGRRGLELEKVLEGDITLKS